MNDVQDQAPPFESNALRAISIRERVEDLLRPYLEEFTETIHELRMHQRTYGGAWVLGVRSASPEEGRWCRLEFEIVVNAEKSSAAVSCKSTTFNRDHPVQTCTVQLDDAGLVRLGDFFETAFLLYASRYYEHARQAH